MGRRRKETRLGGKNPLSYMGIEANDSPVLLLSYDRAPTSSDKSNFRVGTIWHDRSVDPVDVWMLVSLDPNFATWIKLLTNSASTKQYDTNSGSAFPSSGIINILGESVLTTLGTGNTITASFSEATDGQVIIGGGSCAEWGNITSIGGTVVINQTANGINFETAGLSALLTLTSDSGVATEAAGNIDIFGGTNLNTSAAGNTLFTQLDTNIDIPGSLMLSAQGVGVLQTSAAGVMSSSAGEDGQVLISATGASTEWANITSTDGSIEVTNGPNSVNLEFANLGIRYTFMAFQGTASATILGGSSSPGYYLGDSSTLGQMQEVFDSTSVFNPGSAGIPATFTAPIDGKYYLCMKVIFRAAYAYYEADNFFTLRIETSNRQYMNRTKLYFKIKSSASYVQREIYVCADMDAGDTAQYFVNVSTAATTSNFFRVQDTAGYRDTWVCGYLL